MERDAAPSSKRLLLFGLYELGFRSLEALLARGRRVAALVTKPECVLEAQPLVRLAREAGVPVLAPESPRDASFLRQARLLRPELIAVAGYHKILPASLLRLPPLGVLNLHGSLLPRYRGPCPWKWAILNGETRSGATVQRMGAELDRGDILAQADLAIDPEDTGETLFLKISAIAGPLLARTIGEFASGRIAPRPQDESQATYQGYPTDEDTRISWEDDAERIRNLIRGFCPRPGAWTIHAGKKLRVRRASLAGGPIADLPGMILGRSEESLLVSTGRGNLSISGVTVDGGETAGLAPGTFFSPSPQCESNLGAP